MEDGLTPFFDRLHSPLGLLEQFLGDLPQETVLRDYERWWEGHGRSISEEVDRAGVPHLRMFDRLGNRVDEILYPEAHEQALAKGYEAGHVWRAFEEHSLETAFLLGYITCYYDAGLYCPYTVSLATAVAIHKYARSEVTNHFLHRMQARDENVWEGATWMTEKGGGSDLGGNVETTARQVGDRWYLTGDKYFASNVGAELAVVVAREPDAGEGLRGLSLFLVPRYTQERTLNYHIRRLKSKIGTHSVPTGEVELRDAEAYRLESPTGGIEPIMDVLNVSRVANAVGSVALAQRAMDEALDFAEHREAFGKPIFQQPLMRRQFRERMEGLQRSFVLAWEAVQLLDEMWEKEPPYGDRHRLFRLVAHLAKYGTAEFAVSTARWGIEVHGGAGTLTDYPAERWFREAIILAIWEGTSHRQMLDALDILQRYDGHELLFDHLAPLVDEGDLEDIREKVTAHLDRPNDEQEAYLQPVFEELAGRLGEVLMRKWAGG